MELHPYLELNAAPSPNLWYVLSPAQGSTQFPPTMRLGHTVTQLGSKLYVIGGANPSGPFADTYTLDLNTFMWDCLEDASGFKARYQPRS